MIDDAFFVDTSSKHLFFTLIHMATETAIWTRRLSTARAAESKKALWQQINAVAVNIGAIDEGSKA